MSLYLKWQTTLPDTQDRFTANLFSNVSKRWYPVNIIGSTLYDVFSMYGAEFSSGSIQLTTMLNNLSIDAAQEGPVSGHTFSKLYENFGILVQANKLPSQQFSIFDTGSVQNSYREMLKMLFLAHTEGSTPDALARIGQAINGISPIIIEPMDEYQGMVLTNYTGSVYAVFANSGSGREYLIVNPALGRYGHIIPVVSGSNVPIGSKISVSFDVLGVNSQVWSKEFLESGVWLYFFISSGSISTQFGALQTFIQAEVSRLLPANIQPQISYLQDFVLWKPVGLLQDTPVSGSNVWNVSRGGWIYNATPTNFNGTSYITDVVTLPL